MITQLERRAMAVELRVSKDEKDAATITGHAAVFNQDSDPLGGFIERIAPGAFRQSIANGDDVRALFNHDANLILGRTRAKTLALREDETGLHVAITPPQTSYAKDLLESIARGDISQMSFAFQTLEDKWERGAEGKPDVRTLLRVKIYDVSPVTYPAYPDTDVAVRSHQTWEAAQTPGVSNYDLEREKLRVAEVE